MENVKLFILRLILVSVIIGIVAGTKPKDKHFALSAESSSLVKTNDQQFYLKPKLETPKHVSKPKGHKKHSKKSKRDAYSNYAKYWAKSSNFGYGGYSNNLPLYLVYNRKVGAYYPYYKYPKENSVRRNGNKRRMSNNSQR